MFPAVGCAFHISYYQLISHNNEIHIKDRKTNHSVKISNFIIRVTVLHKYYTVVNTLQNSLQINGKALQFKKIVFSTFLCQIITYIRPCTSIYVKIIVILKFRELRVFDFRIFFFFCYIGTYSKGKRVLYDKSIRTNYFSELYSSNNEYLYTFKTHFVYIFNLISFNCFEKSKKVI